MVQLTEYINDQIWILEYPVRFGGMDLFGRTTIIKLSNGELIIHDPCRIDDAIKKQIDDLGEVKFIIAPGNFHHLFVTDFQQQYPEAETFICPGLERKRPDIRFDWVLGNKPDTRWEDTLDQVLIQGTRIIWEVAFFHKPSQTLILVDLLENIGDDYQHHAGLYLRFWWKLIFRMWNNPKAAPEYQVGWGKKNIVKIGLHKILSWNAERVILAHGENIESNVNNILRKAWKRVLNT
ncbi:MAG: hypothetical protein AMJ55_12670 [Gammaproteobacteria bacterium SG8_15]|nr:MAG: hypothetical protein AMJ55_12670 [Gammaproteobacteria bacterium SG8_15]